MASAIETGLVSPIAFTERETQILNLIAKGRTTKEIADELWLSINTVESHRKRMIKRVNAKNIFGVFNYTISNGIINPLVFGEPCFM
jgi:DNA-binding CsgD family transcriptional regulator